MRGRSWIAVAVAFLFGLFLTLFFAQLNVSSLQSSVQSQIEQQLGRKVSLGKVRLRLFPLRVSVHDVVISEHPDFGDSPFIKADSMLLSVRLLPLIKSRIEVYNVEFQRPQIELVKNPRGDWNVASLGLPSVINLELHDGRISLVRAGHKEQVYDHIDATVQNYTRGGPFSVDGMARAGGGTDAYIRLSGRGSRLSRNILSTPFDGTLSFDKFPIGALGTIVGSEVHAPLGGVVTGKAKVSTENGTASVAGDFRLDNFRDVSHPVEIASVALTITPSDIRSNQFEIRSGQMTAVARFTLNQYWSLTPILDLALRSNDATFTDVRSIAKACGFNALSRIDGTGGLSFELYAHRPLREFQSAQIAQLLGGNAAFNLSNVRVAGADPIKGILPNGGRVEIEHAAGRLTLNRGVARTNDLRATLNIGNAAAAGFIDLKNETLNLRTTAILTKEATKEVTGSKPANIMSALGMNKNGELTVTGVITGTFENPKFKPSKEKIALSQIKNILPSAENPTGFLGSLMRRKGQK